MIEQVNLLMANLPIIAGAPNLADWVTAHVWPEFISSKVAMSRILKHGEDFKGSASEALSVYSVIRAYLQKFQMLGHHDLEFAMKVQSFLAICSLIDELRSTMGDGPIDPDSIHNKVVLHLTSFVAAYGEQGFLPKHHYTLHLSQCARRHSCLLSTFVHERRHKLIKRYATQIANAGAWFERTISCDQTLAHLNHMLGQDEEDLPTFLISCRLRLLPAWKPASNVVILSLQDFLSAEVDRGLTSKRAILASGRMCKEKDIVGFFHEGVSKIGQIRLHVHVNHGLFSLITVCDAGNDINCFVMSEDDHVWTKTDQIIGCYVYRWDSHDTITVVPPHA